MILRNRIMRLTLALCVGALLALSSVAAADILINEVDCDQTSTDSAEFIELYNPGGSSVDLGAGGYVIVLYNGSDDASYDAHDLSGTIAAGDYFVIGSASVANVDQTEYTTNGVQNGADGVGLWKGTSAASFPNDTPVGTTPGGATLIDGLVYDTNDSDDAALIAVLSPGEAQINEDAESDKDTDSIQRLGDGAGGAFVTSSMGPTLPNPGAANAGAVPVELGVFSIE